MEHPVDVENVRAYLLRNSGNENVERWKLTLLKDLNHPDPHTHQLVAISARALFNGEFYFCAPGVVGVR